MKIKTIFFVVILIFVTTLIINLTFDNNKEEFKPLELNVGDTFEELNYKNTMYVLNYMIEDVTGDNEKDMVILIGEKDENEMKYKNIDVVVYDTINKNFLNAGLKNLKGELPKLFLGDLTGDNISDIIMTIDTENKVKEVRVVSLKNDSLKEIFGAKENKGINFVGDMIDGIKAHVKCNKLNKELYIDLSDIKSELIKNQKVDESGKIIHNNKKIATSGFTSVELVNLNNQNGIQTKQIIYAFDGTEIVDEITVIWKFEEGKWQVKEAKGARVGNLIY